MVIRHGTSLSDTIRGFLGDDEIWGYAGNDYLDGGAGNDRIYGGLGNDFIVAGLGDDDLAPKFYPVLSSLQRFWVAAVAAVAAGCGAEPFRLRSTASPRGLMV